MWPRKEITDLLNIEHPIIQAPMAGAATVPLAAAVSNAGGMGSLGCATMSVEETQRNAEELAAATDGPFNLNFFVHADPGFDAGVLERTREKLKPVYDDAGLDGVPESLRAPFGTFGDDMFSLLLDLKPPVVSFHFGVPRQDRLKALKQAGCVVLCSATTVAEARIVEAAGVDAVIAQGWEAGGHRGSFEVQYEDAGIGTMALVPQIVDAVELPVIATGGIADGRGIAAAFALGASGVQLGTAFLSCPECRISGAHRKALQRATDDDTRLTRAFSGRPARAKNNPYIQYMAGFRSALPDFPTMYGLSDPLRQTGADDDEPRYQFMLYGQAAALNRELPAGDLMQQLVDETRLLLAG